MGILSSSLIWLSFYCQDGKDDNKDKISEKADSKSKDGGKDQKPKEKGKNTERGLLACHDRLPVSSTIRLL